MLRTFSLLLLAAWLGGCNSMYRLPEYEAGNPRVTHHIGSDLDGGYESYRVESEAETKDREASAVAAGVSPEYLAYQELLDAIEKDMRAHLAAGGSGKPLKVLLFFHGGLNHPQDNDNRLALHLACLKADYYPIFVSWRSGLWVAIGDRYTLVSSGEADAETGFKSLVRGLGFYLPSDVLGGFAAFPETMWDQTGNFYKSLGRQRLKLDRDIPENAGVTYGDVLAWERSRRDTTWQTVGLYGKKLVPGAFRLVTTPIVQGFATPAWSMMLRRAENIMYMEADVKGSNHAYCGNFCSRDRGNGVVAVLARRLEQINQRLKLEGASMEITLVGHSMGAIVANELVASYPELPYKKIIHMGAADSMRNWLDKTGHWLRSQRDAGNSVEFYNLVLHPRAEEREDGSVIGVIPNGSLLVWLDDMLTRPDHILDRRSGRWENARYLLATYKELGNSHLKVFSLNKSGAPQKHGDFSKFRFWEPEFYWKPPAPDPDAGIPLRYRF